MKTLSTQLSSITAPLRAFVALVLISAGAFLGAPPALAAPGSQLYYWDVTGQALVDTMTNHPPSLTNAVAIAMGYQHVLALRADGKVVGWGNNQVGQTNVPPDLSGVVTIGAGRFHTRRSPPVAGSFFGA